jgi:hypothetical protein
MYLEELYKMPALANWLRMIVLIATGTMDRSYVDVSEASQLPEMVATDFCYMYAHGMHFRIRNAKEEKVTCDSTLASSMWRRKPKRIFQESGEMETMDYIGWIEEILELNYRSHYCIVLLFL